MSMTQQAFPIADLLPEILRSLAGHPRLVLEAPPGAGKTTQVPLALLDAPWRDGRKIVMLEPRRVAARAAAGFMAKQLGEAVGDTVGYRIRFENRVSAKTRVEVVTEGILTRMLQDDPMLEDVAAILFDEFHERHLAGDLGLALALDVQAGLREDLRIVAMSATLDGEKLAQCLDAPRLSSAGRSFPVKIGHVAARRDEAMEHQVKRAVAHALSEHPGDLLVFLPGQREIGKVQALLADAIEPSSTEVLALHGELPVEQQSRVLQPSQDGRRRVVLATNVAESSVTLPGVRVVIDSGLAREPRYDPNSGFSRLDVVNIAQASADQRAGRAGRVAEGWAYRLWPESQRLEPQRRPEIAQIELAALVLELAAWGSDSLRFVDAPPMGAMSAARDLLRRLGALDAHHAITALGRKMLAIGTHPRLAAMLLSTRDDAETALACDSPRCWKRAIPSARCRAADAATHWPRAGRHSRRCATAACRPRPRVRRCRPSMPPPHNGVAACAATRSPQAAHLRTCSATCSRTRSRIASRIATPPTCAATSSPTGAWCSCSTTAR
jgi:ATP-dependent helicase HrpB